MKAPSVKPVRCAIYTRVSTDHGLDQEFNSLDAQYDAASAYIKSQAHAGYCRGWYRSASPVTSMPIIGLIITNPMPAINLSARHALTLCFGMVRIRNRAACTASECNFSAVVH